MKNVITLFLTAALAVSLAGCSNTVENTPPPDASTSISEPADSGETGSLGFADVPEEWETMHATFVREDSSQYNNATLMMKYLDNGCVLFEFRLMEGSESEDFAFDTIVPGVLIIDDNGAGLYETIPDAENPFSIRFALSADGKTVDVTHDGALAISPDGKYSFGENGIEVSDTSAFEIIAFLPTAATSLNSNLGAYTVNYPDALISDWFYTVDATFDDSGTVLAKFLIAKDLSAVFRADDDIEPVMIFGSAQPMMDAYVMVDVGSSSAENSEDGADDDYDGPEYEPRPLVYVTLDNGASLRPGTSSRIEAVIPGDLPYTLTAESLNEGVAIVDENGLVTAVGEGETGINCVVRCEDGIAEIGVYIYVTAELEEEDVITE